MTQQYKNIALILAAGRGRRAGKGLPKTYRKINGEMVLQKSINAFASINSIDLIQVVIHPDDISLYQKINAPLNILPPVLGGSTRALSVANGLKALEDVKGVEKVLIHDGARPFVSEKVILSVLSALDEFDGALPTLLVTDALWEVEGKLLTRPIPRDNIRRAQTPQGFRFSAYNKLPQNHPNALDDAEIAIANGLDIGFVEGEADNIKLTFPEDFEE